MARSVYIGGSQLGFNECCMHQYFISSSSQVMKGGNFIRIIVFFFIFVIPSCIDDSVYFLTEHCLHFSKMTEPSYTCTDNWAVS